MRKISRIDLTSPVLNEEGVYNNGDVAIFSDLNDIPKTSLVTGFYAVILCTCGRSTVCLNGITYTVQPNDLFVCPPNAIVENALMSIDFKCCCICFKLSYIERIIPISEQSWSVKALFEQSPCAHLSDDMVETFLVYYNLICSRINHSSERHMKNIVEALLVALMYESRDVIEHVSDVVPRQINSREAHFQEFIELLSNSYPKSRSVKYYAEQLCITPKYLSSICKSVGKKSALKIINIYVERDIEYQLRHTQKSIKEISSELGFPSMSFFGKYVKNAFGKSPKTIRESRSEDMSATTEDKDIFSNS